MNRRTAVVAMAVLAATAVAAAPAGAAPKKKPKSFTKTVAFTDQTPDPTGDASQSGANDCTSRSLMPAAYPRETPISVTVKAPGKLKVALDNKLDWALEITDSKGTVLASSDGSGPTDVEGTTAKLKKAGKYFILPCNMTGEPTVNVTYTYTPA